MVLENYNTYDCVLHVRKVLHCYLGQDCSSQTDYIPLTSQLFCYSFAVHFSFGSTNVLTVPLDFFFKITKKITLYI